MLLTSLCLVGCGSGAKTVTTEVEEPEVQEPDPFNLSVYRWSNRPLVLISPADDPRLAEQDELLAERSAGLVDRDMVVVRLAGDAGEISEPATVEPRRLEPDEVTALRERFDVAADEFAVILVGKDGGEKRRDSQPVAMEQIFDEIDAMPMRHREASGG